MKSKKTTNEEIQPMTKQVTINYEQELYVIPENGGYSCMGFNILNNSAKRLASELGRCWNTSAPHTVENYQSYQKLVNLAHKRFLETGRKAECELHPMLKNHVGERVEVTFQDGTKERFNVGQSTGYIPCLLRLHNRISRSGSAISCEEPIKSVRVEVLKPVCKVTGGKRYSFSA